MACAYVMLCYVMLCYGMLCFVMLCYLSYVKLCYVLLCMLCYVLLCSVLLCYVMLCMDVCMYAYLHVCLCASFIHKNTTPFLFKHFIAFHSNTSLTSPEGPATSRPVSSSSSSSSSSKSAVRSAKNTAFNISRLVWVLILMAQSLHCWWH